MSIQVYVIGELSNEGVNLLANEVINNNFVVIDGSRTNQDLFHKEIKQHLLNKGIETTYFSSDCPNYFLCVYRLDNDIDMSLIEREIKKYVV